MKAAGTAPIPRRPDLHPALHPKARFRYQRDDTDFGPFDAEGLVEEIAALRVVDDTQIFEERSNTWFAPNDVGPFAAACADAAVEAEAAALSNQTERAEHAVRKASKQRWWVANAAIIAGLAVIAGAVWYVLSGTTTAPSNVQQHLFAPLALDPIAEWVPPDPVERFRAPILTAPEIEKVAKRSKRKSRSRTTGADGAGGQALIDTDGDAAQASGAVEFDFADEVVGGGDAPPPLDEIALNEFNQAAAAAVTPCFEAEATQRSEFRGGTIAYSVQPAGNLSGIRLVNAGKVTPALVQCIKRKLGSRRVPAFSGSARSVRLPMRVSGGP